MSIWCCCFGRREQDETQRPLINDKDKKTPYSDASDQQPTASAPTPQIDDETGGAHPPPSHSLSLQQAEVIAAAQQKRRDSGASGQSPAASTPNPLADSRTESAHRPPSLSPSPQQAEVTAAAQQKRRDSETFEEGVELDPSLTSAADGLDEKDADSGGSGQDVDPNLLLALSVALPESAGASPQSTPPTSPTTRVSSSSAPSLRSGTPHPNKTKSRVAQEDLLKTPDSKTGRSVTPHHTPSGGKGGSITVTDEWEDHLGEGGSPYKSTAAPKGDE